MQDEAGAIASHHRQMVRRLRQARCAGAVLASSLPRWPHPIFARVVLAEKLARLIGQPLVAGRRRLGVARLRLWPIRS